MRIRYVGSQHSAVRLGRHVFEVGAEHDVDDELGALAVAGGWFEPAEPTQQIEEAG